MHSSSQYLSIVALCAAGHSQIWQNFVTIPVNTLEALESSSTCAESGVCQFAPLIFAIRYNFERYPLLLFEHFQEQVIRKVLRNEVA